MLWRYWNLGSVNSVNAAENDLTNSINVAENDWTDWQFSVSQALMVWISIRSTSLRCFQWVPTTWNYLFVERQETYMYYVNNFFYLELFSTPEQMLRVRDIDHPLSVICCQQLVGHRGQQYWPSLNETCSEGMPLWNLGQIWNWAMWSKTVTRSNQKKIFLTL